VLLAEAVLVLVDTTQLALHHPLQLVLFQVLVPVLALALHKLHPILKSQCLAGCLIESPQRFAAHWHIEG
jgi:hypothetical protein